MHACIHVFIHTYSAPFASRELATHTQTYTHNHTRAHTHTTRRYPPHTIPTYSAIHIPPLPSFSPLLLILSALISCMLHYTSHTNFSHVVPLCISTATAEAGTSVRGRDKCHRSSRTGGNDTRATKSSCALHKTHYRGVDYFTPQPEHAARFRYKAYLVLRTAYRCSSEYGVLRKKHPFLTALFQT